MHSKIFRALTCSMVLLASMSFISCSDDEDARLVTPFLFEEEPAFFSPAPFADGMVLSWEADPGAAAYRVILKEDGATRILFTDDCSLALNLGASPRNVYYKVVAVGPDGKQSRIHDVRIESVESLLP
jgi:hypothetical protein